MAAPGPRHPHNQQPGLDPSSNDRLKLPTDSSLAYPAFIQGAHPELSSQTHAGRGS